jgi:hypothetical protein
MEKRKSKAKLKQIRPKENYLEESYLEKRYLAI